MRKKTIIFLSGLMLLFFFQFLSAQPIWPPSTATCKFYYDGKDCGTCVCPGGNISSRDGLCDHEAASCYNNSQKPIVCINYPMP